MSSREKREQRIRNNPANVLLEDFEALVNQYGYIREGAKHPQAMIGKTSMTYRRTNPLHVVYVKELLHIIKITFPGKGRQV